MIALIVIASVAAWLGVGYTAARRAAPIAYRNYRARWVDRYSFQKDVAQGQGTAAMVASACLLLGPLGWSYVFIYHTTEQMIPELRAARAQEVEKAHRAEVEALQRQINDAHKALGIAPLKELA